MNKEISKYSYFVGNINDEELNDNVVKCILIAIDKFINNNCFIREFPLKCDKHQTQNIGVDKQKFISGMKGHIPEILGSNDVTRIIFNKQSDKSQLVQVMNVIEFAYKHLCYAELINKDTEYYSCTEHQHYKCIDSELQTVQTSFINEINICFEQHTLNFELQQDGKIYRKIADELVKMNDERKKFKTIDPETDNLLDTAYNKFLSADLKERKTALEKLWDAFERIKTLEHSDKQKSVEITLTKLFKESSKLKCLFEDEMNELTSIGNKFRIRHHETNKELIRNSLEIDYLFHRMSATIHALLKGLSAYLIVKNIR